MIKNLTQGSVINSRHPRRFWGAKWSKHFRLNLARPRTYPGVPNFHWSVFCFKKIVVENFFSVGTTGQVYFGVERANCVIFCCLFEILFAKTLVYLCGKLFSVSPCNTTQNHLELSSKTQFWTRNVRNLTKSHHLGYAAARVSPRRFPPLLQSI